MSKALRAPSGTAPQASSAPPGWLTRLRQSVGQNRIRKFAYEHPDASMSLRDGLEEYYSSDPGLLAPADVSHDVAIGLRAHDAAHVVFGCDTSVRGEVVLARWSLFGAEDGIQIYLRGLRSKETRFLFVDFFRRVRPAMLLLAAFDGMRALIRSISLRKRWPSFEWENYADRPLTEIRSDFKIRVL